MFIIFITGNEKEPEILAAWQNAESAGLYRNVNDVNGKLLAEGYATRNQLEYFAELSAAYFVGIWCCRK